ncbi:M14 family metallopeptidase [Gallaecimonas kandeliae]|uniref:M14 family metallopeptidase n=1 Tax=Gallaecimonas kandeliae TaxID=3029055 RepID=UPI0026477F65|nr:M14 family metallopeptidase [Gallaecimonas kandeliae]WKE67203.1 M14 family metallopeptidase [Gallaecimonas kandeliae]
MLLPLLLSAAITAPLQAPLPPEPAWQGKTLALINTQDPTPVEAAGFAVTPDYAATVAYLKTLAAGHPALKLSRFGKSGQGRDLWAVTLGQPGNGKPTLLLQAGIHAGEIDGKDAGLMFLRDWAAGQHRALLAKVNLVFVPIFNADGHERAGPFNRPNQRGPQNMGWRSNARNLNLNRDYTKLDTPEMRAMVALINEVQPSLYVDVHVTDGEDWQYDSLIAINTTYAPKTTAWLTGYYRPRLYAYLKSQGHMPGDFLFLEDGKHPQKGAILWQAEPRYSNGYGPARNLPTVLVENHSLKPYQRRVLATYALIEESLRLLADDGKALQQAIAADDQARPAELPLAFGRGDKAERKDIPGVGYQYYQSPVSGAEEVRWTGEPLTWKQVPVWPMDKPVLFAKRPKAYVIPAQWPGVIQRLAEQGIQMERLDMPLKLRARQYHIDQFQFAKAPFEGHFRVSTQGQWQIVDEKLPAGSVRISTDQPLGNLAMLLLEPQAPDSFLQWGFFNAIFSRTEYMEPYVIAPMAEAMLKEPKLKAAFEKALADPAFKADPEARLRWFYERSPYFDQTYLRYPVLREE